MRTKAALYSQNSLLLLCAVLLLALAPVAIMQSGLLAPATVSTYANGVFPGTPPGQGTGAWIIEDAFPNLVFNTPIHLEEEPGTQQMWLGEQQGRIVRFDKDSAANAFQVVLDLTSSTYHSWESGLLGFAFHPQYGDSNYLYVFYQFQPNYGVGNNDLYTRVSRFDVDTATRTALIPTERVLIQQFDQSRNHNAGAIFFDDEGFLFVCVGDEGGSNNQYQNAQRLDYRLFAGILRIDVDCDSTRSHPIRRQPTLLSANDSSYTANYLVPNDNPFLDSAGAVLEEFYAIGMRNPYRTTYDAVEDRIWSGDVGQNQWEEINLIEKGGNYQWAYREGQTGGPNAQPAALSGVETGPVYEYDHTGGNNCIIGGYIYRGSEHPDLYGKYLFSDNGSRRVWAMTYMPGFPTVVEELTTLPFGSSYNSISAFGCDLDGEAYILRLDGPNGGKIFKLARQNPGGATAPDSLSLTNVFTDLTNLDASNFLIPYEMRVPFWSDGAHKYRWLMVPNDGTHNTVDEQIQYSEEGAWDFPEGAVLVKHFEYPVDETDPTVVRRLETRFSIKDSSGEYYGLSYRWNEAQTEATLLTGSRTDTLEIQTASGTRTTTWYFPSSNDCRTCHNETAGGSLGPITRQLNCDAFYPLTGLTANQLTTYSYLEMFDTPPDTNQLGTLLMSYAKDDVAASLTERARSYIDANCASCHQPGTGILASFDARLSTPLDSQGIIYGAAQNLLGLHDPRIVIPGDLENSTLYQRLKAVHNTQAMPPLAKSIVDSAGVELIADWITSLSPAYVWGGMTHQRIDFPEIPNLLTTDPPYTLNASSTAGLAITYTVVSGPATVVGNVLTPTGGEGYVTLVASQAGDAAHEAAPEVEQTFLIRQTGYAEGTGLVGLYLNGLDISNAPVSLVRLDSVVDFYWGNDRPDAAMPFDSFAVIWEGFVEPTETGTYTFSTRTDDGIRLYVNNQLLIDEWQGQAAKEFSGTISLTAWQQVPIRLEYYEQAVFASAQLKWTPPGRETEIIPSYLLYPDPGALLNALDWQLEGYQAQDEIQLNWNTRHQQPLFDYEVLRKNVSGEFEVIAVTDLDISAPQASAVDPFPNTEENQYRIRAKTESGETVLSEVLSVWVRSPILGNLLTVFPSPVSSDELLHIQLRTESSAPAVATLYNLRGQVERSLSLDQGTNVLTGQLSLVGIKPSVYLLVVRESGRQFIQKIIVR